MAYREGDLGTDGSVLQEILLQQSPVGILEPSQRFEHLSG